MSDNPTAGGTPAPAASEAAPAAAAATPAPPPASVVHEAPAAPAPGAQAAETLAAEAPAGGAEAAPAPGTEAAPAAEEKPDAPAEAAPTEAGSAVAYTDFKLPEGVTILPEKLAEATGLLGKYGVPQEAAQELVNLHVAALQNTLQHYQQTAADFWNKRSKEWVAEVQNDSQIGGNRLETSLSVARGVWNEVLPNKADRDRLFADFNDTKMGDHPVLTRAMTEVGRRMAQVLQATGTTTWAAAMKKIREPAAPPPGTPARAPGASGRAADRRYQSRHQGA